MGMIRLVREYVKVGALRVLVEGEKVVGRL